MISTGCGSEGEFTVGFVIVPLGTVTEDSLINCSVWFDSFFSFDADSSFSLSDITLFRAPVCDKALDDFLFEAVIVCSGFSMAWEELKSAIPSALFSVKLSDFNVVVKILFESSG